MSIGIYNVNKLFTIKRVSETCKRLDIDRWIDGMFWWGREQDVMGDGMVWGSWIGKGDVDWAMVLSLVGL